MAKETGNSVSVLISGDNYCNYNCTRQLPANATDEKYKEEFDKAIELADHARVEHGRLSDLERMFNNLLQEYKYIQKMAVRIAERVEGAKAKAKDKEAKTSEALKVYLEETGQTLPVAAKMNEIEAKVVARFQEFTKLLEGYKHEWTWDQILMDGLADMVDEKGKDDSPSQISFASPL